MQMHCEFVYWTYGLMIWISNIKRATNYGTLWASKCHDAGNIWILILLTFIFLVSKSTNGQINLLSLEVKNSYLKTWNVWYLCNWFSDTLLSSIISQKKRKSRSRLVSQKKWFIYEIQFFWYNFLFLFLFLF